MENPCPVSFSETQTQTALILSSGGEYPSTMMMIAKVDNSSKGNRGKPIHLRKTVQRKINLQKKTKVMGKIIKVTKEMTKAMKGKTTEVTMAMTRIKVQKVKR